MNPIPALVVLLEFRSRGDYPHNNQLAFVVHLVDTSCLGPTFHFLRRQGKLMNFQAALDVFQREAENDESTATTALQVVRYVDHVITSCEFWDSGFPGNIGKLPGNSRLSVVRHFLEHL